MTVNINYSNKSLNETSSNIVLFANEKFNTDNIKKYVTDNELSYIKDLLKTSDLKKNIFVYELNSKKKIILISIKNKLRNSDIENLGAEFYGRVNYGKNSEYFILSDSILGNNKNFLGLFLHGLKLKSYEFNKYKTKKDTRLILINVVGNKNKTSSQNQLKFKGT